MKQVMWQEIRDYLFDELDLSREIPDEELWELIRNGVRMYGGKCLLSLAEREKYERQIFNSFRKLDVLQDLLDDSEITEIMVNGTDHIFYEKHGTIYAWEHAGLTEEKLLNIIQKIVGTANRTVNAAKPIVDARLPDGSRVNIVLPPVSVDGPMISIRKFTRTPMTLQRLLELGSLSEEMVQMLQILVQAGYNIFVSGGTGSGKTTFLNALSEFIPLEQRVVTIEDSAELQMRTLPNLIRLETREENGSGADPIGIRALIRTALRMRPDRIIVGEVRGAEALDMLQAMNTGHDGSLSTGHANSAADMLSRLETMVLMGMNLPLLAIRKQIASGIDVIVHLARMRDKSRKVVQISEVAGVLDGEIQLRTLYEFREIPGEDGEVNGCWEKRGTLQNRKKLAAEGLEEAFLQLGVCNTE